MNNLFEEIPNSLPKELVEVLAENSDVRIERIVSTGHSSPADFWYDQPRHEWVVLLKGEARLLFEDDGESLHMEISSSLPRIKSTGWNGQHPTNRLSGWGCSMVSETTPRRECR